MAKKTCAKCGKAIGFFTSNLVSGKYYCEECSKSVPRTYLDCQCYQCAYYGVDENYNGFCKRDYDRYVDRYQVACDKFSK